MSLDGLAETTGGLEDFRNGITETSPRGKEVLIDLVHGPPPHRLPVAEMKLILPDESDPEAVLIFALSFNGYEELGSFETSAAAAQLKERATLRDIRNELFFAARASRHGGDDYFVDVYLELLPLFRKWANADAGRVDRS